MTDLVRPADGVQIRGLRREEYERLVDLGVFEGEHIELLGGEIIRVSPQGSPHGWTITRLTAQLAPLMGRGYEVRVQLPLAVDDVSLPEPDVAVADLSTPAAHPVAAHAAFEVSVSSQRLDLVHKAPRYAGAGVPLYVVLDLPRQQAVVHTDPGRDGYGTVRRVGPDAALEVLGVALDLRELLSALAGTDGAERADGAEGPPAGSHDPGAVGPSAPRPSA